MVVNNLRTHLDWLETSGASNPGIAIQEALVRARSTAPTNRAIPLGTTELLDDSNEKPPNALASFATTTPRASSPDPIYQDKQQRNPPNNRLQKRMPSIEIISPPEHEHKPDKDVEDSDVDIRPMESTQVNAEPNNVEQYIKALERLRMLYESTLRKHNISVSEASKLAVECDILRAKLGDKPSSLLDKYCDQDPNFFDITTDDEEFEMAFHEDPADTMEVIIEKDAIPDTDNQNANCDKESKTDHSLASDKQEFLGKNGESERANDDNLPDIPDSDMQMMDSDFELGDQAHPLEVSSPDFNLIDDDEENWQNQNGANDELLSLHLTSSPSDVELDLVEEIVTRPASTEVVAAQPAKTRALTAAELEDFMNSSDDDSMMPSRSRPVMLSSQESICEVAVAPSTVKRYSWSNEVDDILHKKFGLRSFRSNQLEAINATLEGKDVFVLMPTGGGKSLCYQLPSMVTKGITHGTTVVISPLISLMQDQVRGLKERNIAAEYINSSCSRAEKNQVMSMLFSGQLNLLYCSPEMLNLNSEMKRTLLRLHDTNKLARFVIDEAHCISQWGHDFRPDYRTLGDLHREFKNTPIMALTATANLRVSRDILSCLRASNRVTFKQSFNRPNLTYVVRAKPGASILFNEVAAMISKHKQGSGIIYCATQQQCQNSSQRLKDMGFSVNYYHAGMPNDERELAQRQWQSGAVRAVFATTAFGMGIDKPDVRFVIHLTLPRTMEGYYQETGRAGRDGKPSECILYYAFKDVSQLERLVKMDRSLKYEDRQHQIEMLNQVKQYCENKVDCRRRQVLQYFNEPFEAEQCAKTCDNCATGNKRVLKNLTAVAAQIVEMVQHIQASNVTLVHCVNVFRGSRVRKIMDMGHNTAPHYGAGSTHLKSEVERVFQRLIGERYLEEYARRLKSGFSISYIRTGPQAKKLLAGKATILVDFDIGTNDPPPYSQVFNKGATATPQTPRNTTVNSNDADQALWTDEVHGRPSSTRRPRPLTPVDLNLEPTSHKRAKIKETTTNKASNGPRNSTVLEPNSDLAQLLYGELELRRLQLQDRNHLPRPEDVCSDEALEQISTQCPQTIVEFGNIKELTTAQRATVYANFRVVIKKFLSENSANNGEHSAIDLRSFTYKA